MTGSKLLHYEIAEKLGEGGMGEVYRAKDTKLGRSVALKILPADFAADAERLARFDREARLLATLNHANIASIYGLEQANGKRFLVLEMVDGEDLAERLKRGPVPLDEALNFARQITDALDVAHEHDIIHRDLKPANIKIDKKGEVKVLDFGLGKAMEGSDGADSNLSQSPTIMSGATQAGVILGTAAYMSPEQARGRVVDARADIWAFGCVLYEMLAGRQLFQGETVSDTLAAVLRAEPDWDQLPSNTPPAIRRLLKRCLEKEPKRRLHHIADARIEIEDAVKDPAGFSDASAGAMATAPQTGGKRLNPFGLLVGAILVAAVGAAAGFFLKPKPPAPEKVVRRVGVQVPSITRRFGGVAISPDGKLIVTQQIDPSRLIMRSIESYGYSPIAGSERGWAPIFSPDGKWIAFFNDTKLLRAGVGGGSVHEICTVRGRQRGAWGPNGEIVFSDFGESGKRGLYRVRVEGETPSLLIEPDFDRGERQYGHPYFLPNGRGVLFDIEMKAGRQSAVLDLETGDYKVLATDGSHPRYARSGHVLYVRENDTDLMAMRFDMETLEASGTPQVVIPDGVQPGEYDISAEGTLVYTSTEGLIEDNQVAMYDTDGTETILIEDNGTWAQPRFSPDGKTLIVRQLNPNCVLWSYSLERKTLTRLTFDGDCHDPLWNPDGKMITYSVQKTAGRAVYEMPADGSGVAVSLVTAGEGPLSPNSWSADGKHLLYEERAALTGKDLYIYDRETHGSEVFLKTEFGEGLAAFSADGRWIAYASDESGRDEVYVRPYPGPGGKVQISREGGSSPTWAPAANKLFFVSDEGLMEVTITTGDNVVASTPKLSYSGDADFARVALALTNFLMDRPNNYDVTPDGEKLVVIKQRPDASTGDELRVVTNWFEELKRVVPVE